MANAVTWQRVEGAIVMAAGIALCAQLNAGIPIWAAFLIFLAPDLSFAAYLAGPKTGAAGYNSVHIYGFGSAVMAIGICAGLPILAACGALWLAHSGFDRMLGYGLKLPTGFQDTHLGPIGPAK